MNLLIQGIDRSNWLQPSSLAITEQLNSRSTLRCVLRTDSLALATLEVGSELVVMDGANKMFAGTVSYITVNPVMGTQLNNWSIEAVDYGELTDRHLVFEVYQNKTVGYIVRDIVDRFMEGEGIDTSGVLTDGPVMQHVLFNYNTVNTAFNELSEKTGLQWFIDYDKVLHFYAREDNEAPFVISGNSGQWRNLQIKRTKSNYRNVQYIRGGKNLSDERTEYFQGDGNTRTFTVSMPIAEVPTIQVNGTPQTVAIGGLGDIANFYWNKDNAVVSQDTAETVLSSSDTLYVTYKGFYPILVEAQDPQGIQDRQAIEGGSGKYIRLEVDSRIEDSTLATDKAKGLLRRYGEIPVTVTFETDLPGLVAGQIIEIELPALGLSGEFLIDNLQKSDLEGQRIRQSVRALSGESFGGWTTFFKKLTATSADVVIRENEVLIRLISFRDELKVRDSFSVSTDTDNRVDYAIVDFSQAG